MPISLILLASSLILLLIYIILYWRSYIPVKPMPLSQPTAQQNGSSQQYPGLSVVIITHDADSVLQHTIDSVAAQQYPNFEIIVVNNASTDNTSDVIKRAAKQYPNLLRSTHLPQNRNGFLHMTIATTLGVRAARKDWIVLLRPSSMPKSLLWLQNIADAINQGYEMCIGYNQYYGIDQSAWEKRTIRWYRKRQILNYRAIFRGKRRPIEAESSNFAFRKQDFLDNGGYGRWLSLPNYHEHPYAATFSSLGKTAMLMQPDAQVETMLPPIRELWQTEYHQIRKAYRRLPRLAKLRRRYYTMLTMLLLVTEIALLTGVYFALFPLNDDTSASIVGQYMMLPQLPPIPIAAPCAFIVFLALLLIHIIYKIHCISRDNKRLNTPLVSDPASLLDADDYA